MIALAGVALLVVFFFPFITLNILCYCLLAFKVSMEKSVDSPMGVLLCILVSFSLVFVLVFAILITMSLDVELFGFILLGLSVHL